MERFKMTKSEEIYIKSQLAYLKGKVEVYERYLYTNGILKDPKIIKSDDSTSCI